MMSAARPSALLPTSSRRRLAARVGQFRVVPPTRSRRASRAWHGDRLAQLARPLDKVLGIDRSRAADETVAAAPAAAVGVLAALAAATGLTQLLGLVPGWAGAAGAALGLFAGRAWATARRDAVLVRMEEQFALALGVIIRCVRAGLPVGEAMRAVISEVPAPTGTEFRRCADQIQLGMDFDEALVVLADRCALADHRFFAVAVALQRQTGGNLAETLENLAETIRRRRAVRLKAQALTSETRATVAVLTLLPLGVGGVMLAVSPDYILQLFTTPAGRRLLGTAILVQGAGLAIIRALSRRMLA